MSPYRTMTVKPTKTPKDTPKPTWKLFKRVAHMFIKHTPFVLTSSGYSIRFSFYVKSEEDNLFVQVNKDYLFKGVECVCGKRFPYRLDSFDLTKAYPGAVNIRWKIYRDDVFV